MVHCLSALTRSAAPVHRSGITLDVNDLGNKINTAALNSGHHFYPSMMSQDGCYSPVRPLSQSGTHHFYQVTVPVSASLNLFVDSDLMVHDRNGNTVATRTPTIPISGQAGAVTLSLSVQ